jgi:energy-coupling factor transporter ATP-binding protein EcfA2
MQIELPLIGLAKEQARLAEALRKRQPLLLLGPAGAGKSTLIKSALSGMPASHRAVHLRYSSNLHHLLIDLARCLFESGHGAFRRQWRPDSDIERWLSHQTSVHLKGMLWASLEAEPRTIILDGIDRAGFPAYRFLQRLYFAKGLSLVAAARDPLALGALARLFWDPRIALHVRPLNEADSIRLFDLAVDYFGLRHLKIEEFRDKVLDAAGGIPGQIVEMCRMAGNPMYVSGRYIKFAPLRIDALMKFI